MLDSTLDQLRNSPVTSRFFEADGSLVQVRGGSDAGDTAPPAGDAGDSSTPPPVSEPEGTPPSAPEGTPPAGEPETFDRKYVEELRKESAGYRTKAKSYEEAFDGYDDDSRSAFLSLAKDLLESPEDAAIRMLTVSRDLLGDKFDSYLEDPTPKPLTQADLNRALAEREQQAESQAAVRAVEQEAEALGYKPDTPEQAQLFWIASKETNGDLKAAHEKVQAHKQAVIDAYLEEKKNAGDAFVTPSTAGVGAGAGTGEAPKTFDQARASLMERLRSSPGE